LLLPTTALSSVALTKLTAAPVSPVVAVASAAKPLPEITTWVPAGPPAGAIDAIVGAGGVVAGGGGDAGSGLAPAGGAPRFGVSPPPQPPMPSVSAVAPVASGSALGIKGDASRSVILLGTELGRYLRVVRLDDKVSSGVLQLGPGDALIGIELARDLGVVLGDRFRVQSAQGGSEVFRIRALLDLGSRELNRRYVYTDLRAAQSLLGIPGRVTNLDVSVLEMMKAEEVARRLRTQSGQLIEDWIQTNTFIFTAINNQNIMTTLIKVFISIVVVLGIASVLVVSVVQKRKEIGILRAVGATRQQMLRVFLWQGVIVGVAGALLGSALGFLLIVVFSHVLRDAEGRALFSLDYDIQLIGITVLAAAVLGLLSAALPARNAARLDPAQAIRG